MGRGRSSWGGSGSSGRGRSSWSSSSSSRGRSSWSSSSSRRSSSSRHTVVVFGGGGHRHYGSGVTLSNSASKKILITFGVIFAVIGVLGSILLPNLGENYLPVYAECVDNVYRNDGFYYTVYEYEVEGREYRSISNQGWEEKEVVGRTVKIYYLEEDPHEISEEIPENGSLVGSVIAILCFGGFGALMIVLGAKIKNNKNEEVAETEDSEPLEEQPKVEKSRCLYCGCRYDNGLSSCPQCGASKSNNDIDN